MSVRARTAGLAGLCGLALAAQCARPLALPSRADWEPTRYDYAAFRSVHPEVRDPNYLPFMAHRFALEGSPEDVLVFCRWADEQFPLDVAVEAPDIPESLQDEFDPKEPRSYVQAVERAVTSWERALPGVVRLRPGDGGQPARLRIRLLGEVGPSPQPEVQVLGRTPLANACRVEGGDPERGRLRVRFEVPELHIFVADRFGLLPADQVERLALHEIGHALGMRGHSPIPADLMYEVARDRTVDRLSTEDVNSFLSLYRIPNGTLYARIPRDRPRARVAAAAPEGQPRLDPEPHVDRQLGYAVQLPQGWLRIPTRQGIVAVDGVAWDYEASLQVIVRRYPTIESYLERHLQAHIGSGSVVRQSSLEVAERAAFQVVIEKQQGRLAEEHSFVESGDGRVVVVIADAPTELHRGFAPWFAAVVGSLEILPSAAPSGFPVREEEP